MEQKKTPCCGVARFLTLLDGPWATLIVRELLHGPQRFTQLRDALSGISAHTLTHRLKGFERHGLVTRTAYAETPPRVVYELTPLGEGLRDVLEAMRKWGDAVPDEAAVNEVSDGAADVAEPDTSAACPFSQLGKGASQRSGRAARAS